MSALCEFAMAMSRTKKISEGADLLLAAGREMGLPLVGALDDISTLTPRSDESGNRLADRLGWPKDFVDRWVEKGYTLTAPLFVRARFEHLPHVWMLGDPPIRGEASPQRRIDDELRSLGLTGGIAVPVRMAYGRIGGAHWWGSKPEAELQALLGEFGPDLMVMANYFFALFPQLDKPGVTPEDLANLTAREIECLTQAGSGRTDVEIAAAVGLSQHTVRFHIENASGKLGARTRSHAIALAAQLGLLGKVS